MDVEVKKHAVFKSMGFNCDVTSSRRYEVWYRAGSFDGYEKSASGWALICQGNVACQGSGTVTEFPDEQCVSVDMAPGVHAFHIMDTESTSLDYTSNAGKVGSVYAQNSCLAAMVGNGMRKDWGRKFKDRVCNVEINVDCETGASGMSEKTVYPMGDKPAFIHKNNMPRDGEPEAECDEDADCDGTVHCVNHLCETVDFIDQMAEVTSTSQCGTDGVFCEVGFDCCAGYSCEAPSGQDDKRCLQKPREDRRF